MKKNIIFLIILNITMLSATENVKTLINISCLDSKIFTIKINSNKLNLTENAIQDNIGGYVDIPEDRHYLKIDGSIYPLKNGSIERYSKNTNKQFKSHINLILIDKLKGGKDLKFIQKIIIENIKSIDDFKYTTTTNILDIYLDKDIFNKEYQKCKK